jgi:transposase InsO family protein
MFETLKESDGDHYITFAGNQNEKVLGTGNIDLNLKFSLSRVLLVESLGYNLLSISQLCASGFNCLFTNEGVTVIRRSDGSVAFKGVLKGKLYLVNFSQEKAQLDTCLMAKSSLGWLWHRRLAHVWMQNLNKLLKEGHILGLTNVSFEKDRICSACQAGKQVGVPHPSKSIVTTVKPLELLHMDLFGPVAYMSIGGNKYGLVIVDDYSRFTWVFFLHDKSVVQDTLKKFAKRAQNKFDTKIKKVRSDNGTEFKNTNIEKFLDEEGIGHEFSVPYTPQQNGIAERKNRTLIEAARTMLDEYKVSDQFWAEAINTACHVINRLYLHKIFNKIVYKLLLGKKPNVSYFRVFGSKCFILNKKPKNSKFASKVDEGFLLGYASNAHGYRVFNKTSGCVEVACDVTFDEPNGSQGEQVDGVVGMEESPSKVIKKLATGKIKSQERADQDDDDGDDMLMLRGTSTSTSTAQPGNSDHISGDSGSPIRSIQTEDRTIRITEVEPSTPHQDQSQAKEEIEPIQHEAQVPHPRIHQIIQKDHPVDNILGSISKGVTTRSCLATFSEHYSFVSSLEQALDDPYWVMAMQEELNNFTRNEVWSLVERPKQNVIGTKWVFRNKQDEHGVVTRNKARLVAQGFTQIEGLDFGETYAHVARIESIRILLTFATHHDFKLYQIDVKSAFLNGPISELVYVEQPPGFEDSKFPNHVYTLHEVLYGLKQTPRAWYECLKDFLLRKGFEIGKADPTLFTRKVDKEIFVCQIYVDDILFGSTNQSWCENFSRIMTKRFEMSMMGELTFFLGFQIKQLKEGTCCRSKPTGKQ